MPRFVIPVEKLPPPNSDGNHILRFRIFSEDRNNVSEYSNLYILQSLGQIYPLRSTPVIELNSASTLITVVWDTPSIYNTGSAAIGASIQHNHANEWKTHDADLFARWYGGSSASTFVYLGRSRDNQFATIIPTGSSSATIVGQVANYENDDVYSRQPVDKFIIFSKTIKIK